jgi:hypothetical protein
MKHTVTVLLATIFATTSLAQTAAANSGKKSKTERDPYSGQRIYDDRDRFGWYPRDANQLKFGSKIWFEQMEAEGRFGGRRGRSGG